MTDRRKSGDELKRNSKKLSAEMVNALISASQRGLEVFVDNALEDEKLQNHMDREQIKADIQRFKPAIENSFHAALTEAIFRVPSEEVHKAAGEADLLDSVLPNTFGELSARLEGSKEYLRASLGQIDGPGKETMQYLADVYQAYFCEGSLEMINRMLNAEGRSGGGGAPRRPGT